MFDWLAWLLLPIDLSRVHGIDSYMSWHARLMFLAWMFLVPVAIIVARYYKVLPSQNWPQKLDNQAWWLTHQIFQYTGALLTVSALGLVLFSSRVATVPGPHASMGWTVVVILVVQVLGGWLRGTKGGPTDLAQDGSLRGDHFDMSRRRVLFETVHKFSGYCAVLLALATVLTGLWQTNAPRWMWATLVLWWLLLASVVFILQKGQRAIDTYQAIWGPDPSLPGNKRKPIGLGVRQIHQPPDSES